MNLHHVEVTPELKRDVVLAPLCHRVEVGEVVSLFELEEDGVPTGQRVLVVHGRVGHGQEPAWLHHRGQDSITECAFEEEVTEGGEVLYRLLRLPGDGDESAGLDLT
jgi:hypothetical protein